MGFRRWRAAAMVLVLVATGSCGGEGGKSADVANPRDPVRAMLRQRAERLTAGDLDGWLQPVAPEARAFEEQVGRGARSVPLARVDFYLGAANVDQQGSRFKDAEVQLVFRYKELPDDNVFRLYLRYEIERRQGSWTVTAAAFDERPSLPPPAPWATGPVEVARSPHFLALFRPGLDGVDPLLARAEEGRTRLLPRLTLTPDARHLVVLARNAEEMSELSGEGAAVALAAVHLRSPTGASLERPENRLMFVNVDAVNDASSVATDFKGQPEVLARVVFQHELGHLALSRFDRLPTPSWVSEAGAMELAEERRLPVWELIVENDLFEAQGLEFDELSRSPELTTGWQYAYANAAAFYLIELAGIEKFWDFYQNFKALGATLTTLPEVRASGAQRLVRRYYGFDLDELDTRTREYMRKAVAAGE